MNAHRLKVQSLYKRSLKLALDWTIQRDLWRQEALHIRHQFEQNKHVTNPKEIQALILQTEKKLEDWEHPDPYRCKKKKKKKEKRMKKKKRKKKKG